MFSALIKTLCTCANVKQYSLTAKLGYKSNSAFQKVTTGRDVRLSVLLSVCDALGYTITLSHPNGVHINLNEYARQDAPQDKGQE